MEEEQKNLDFQQENENIQDLAAPPEMVGDKLGKTSPTKTIDVSQNTSNDVPSEEMGGDVSDGTETMAEDHSVDEKNDEGTQTEAKPEDKKDKEQEEDKRNEIKADDVIKKLNDNKCTLYRDKCCNYIKHLFLILLCLGGVIVLSLLMFGVLKVQLNTYSTILIYGLMLILVVAIVALSYMLTTSNRRYSAAIIRLDLLITRIGFKNNGSKMLTDVDRELQLITRILESSNEKSLYL